MRRADERVRSNLPLRAIDTVRSYLEPSDVRSKALKVELVAVACDAPAEFLDAILTDETIGQIEVCEPKDLARTAGDVGEQVKFSAKTVGGARQLRRQKTQVQVFEVCSGLVRGMAKARQRGRSAWENARPHHA